MTNLAYNIFMGTTKIHYQKRSNHLINKKMLLQCLSVLMILFSFKSFAQEEIIPKKKSKLASYRNPEHTAENFMKPKKGWVKRGWFVGADFGPTIFYGDVTLYDNFPKINDFRKSAARSFNVFGGKKFNFGLGAEINLFKGDLKGEKQADKLYRRRFKADFIGYSVSLKYNFSQLLLRRNNDRKFFNRLSLYLNIGVGQTFFRSRLYKLAVNNQWYLENASGFISSGIDSVGTSQSQGGGLVQDKVKTISSIILPIGGKINFKLNRQTNLVLDINYVTCFNDQLDSWKRSWSHKDRYLTTGIGLIYNFGMKDAEEIPDGDRFFRKKEDDQSSANENGIEKISPANYTPPKPGLFRKKDKKEDKDLEIKMKLYELQLKLFEMQYLVK